MRRRSCPITCAHSSGVVEQRTQRHGPPNGVAFRGRQALARSDGKVQGGGSPMRRRELITLVAGAAAWPIGARAQQPGGIRRIGVLINLTADDPEGRPASRRSCRACRNWVDRRPQRAHRHSLGRRQCRYVRRYASELVALAPDVILASGGSVTGPLLQATRTVPIVFTLTPDPVGAGFVDSLARPGGNATGFTGFEYGMSAKWLELLKEIAPRVTRAAVLRDPALPQGIGQFAVVQSVAPTFGVELRPVDVRDAGEIERAVAAFARAPNGGLIVTASGLAIVHRDLILTLAARHLLPAVYFQRFFVSGGGLISYGADTIDQHRRAAGLRRPHPQGREASRPAGSNADQVRASDQPQDRKSTRARSAVDAARPRRRGDRIRRRDLITLTAAGAAAAWPFAARAQHPAMPVIGSPGPRSRIIPNTSWQRFARA